MSGDDSTAGGSGGIAQTLTPNFVRRSFALKFGLVLLVMGMSVGVIGLVATEQVKSETQTNVENEYRSGALQEADIIEQWVSRNRLSTKLMSSDEGWDSNEDLSLKLENEKSELSGEVTGMHIVDTSGEQAEVVASNTLRTGPTLSGDHRAGSSRSRSPAPVTSRCRRRISPTANTSSGSPAPSRLGTVGTSSSSTVST